MSAWSVQRRRARSTVRTRFVLNNIIIRIRAKHFTFVTRDTQQLRSRNIRETFYSYLNDEYRIGYHCTIMAAGIRASFGPCR